MGAHDLGDKVEAQSQPRPAGATDGLAVFFENDGLLRLIDAFALIADRDTDAIDGSECADTDRRPGGRVLGRIVDEIMQGSGQQRLVDDHGHRFDGLGHNRMADSQVTAVQHPGQPGIEGDGLPFHGIESVVQAVAFEPLIKQRAQAFCGPIDGL